WGLGLVNRITWGRSPFSPENRIEARVALKDSAIKEGFRVQVTSSTHSSRLPFPFPFLFVGDRSVVDEYLLLVPLKEGAGFLNERIPGSALADGIAPNSRRLRKSGMSPGDSIPGLKSSRLSEYAAPSNSPPTSPIAKYRTLSGWYGARGLLARSTTRALLACSAELILASLPF